MRQRSPRRILKEIAVVWALAYVVFGWLTLGAIESEPQHARFCFFVFFCLTPVMGTVGYKSIKDAWRGVPESDAELTSSVLLLVAFVVCWFVYKFAL